MPASPSANPDQRLPPVRRPIQRRMIRASVIVAGFSIAVTALFVMGILSQQLTQTAILHQEDLAIDLVGFAQQLITVSVLLMLCSGMVGYFLAKSIAWPLRRLTDVLRQLNPGHWLFARSVRTGDEVEVLDHVIADLTARLKQTYDHLEELVAERTAELAKEYARDRAILESIDSGVLSLDHLGQVMDANPAAIRLLGYAEAELIGTPAEEVLRLQTHKAQRAPDTHPVALCLKTGQPYRSNATMRLSLLKKDQSLLPVILAVTPLTLDGGVSGAIVLFQDVTEDRQIDYMKSEFITLASHQLRTPLSAVRWNLELFNAEGISLTDDQRAFLMEIDASSKRMAAVLDELLHAARLEEENYAASRQDVAVLPLVRGAADAFASAADQAGITLKTELPEAPVTLSTDPTLLQIILQNLLGNAIKYSRRGGEVMVRVARRDDRLQISVQDQGMGIPVAEQGRVFQKFFRARNVRKEDTDGTGLGLYISKRSLESLGGSIGFQSQEGKGSTFIVSLPLKEKKA